MARYTYRDKVRNLVQPGRFSNRALADAIGVNEKTIRRWRTGERAPDPRRYAPDVFDTLELLDREVRRIERNEARRQGYKPPALPVQFPAERVEFIDPADPEAKRKIPGDTIEYDVEEAEEDIDPETKEITEDDELYRLLRFYRDRAAAVGEPAGVRFLVTTTRYKGKKVTHWWPSRSEAQPDITRMSDQDIKDLLDEITLYIGPSGSIHKLRIQDAELLLL